MNDNHEAQLKVERILEYVANSFAMLEFISAAKGEGGLEDYADFHNTVYGDLSNTDNPQVKALALLSQMVVDHAELPNAKLAQVAKLLPEGHPLRRLLETTLNDNAPIDPLQITRIGAGIFAGYSLAIFLSLPLMERADWLAKGKERINDFKERQTDWLETLTKMADEE